MNQEERAALERLLEYVGRGFCAVQSDCKMLRELLERTAPPPVTTDSSAVFVFNPLDLDARVMCLYQKLIPARLLRICTQWESATGTLMNRNEMKRHPWMCFRPWQWTWVALNDRAARLEKARKQAPKRKR